MVCVILKLENVRAGRFEQAMGPQLTRGLPVWHAGSNVCSKRFDIHIYSFRKINPQQIARKLALCHFLK